MPCFPDKSQGTPKTSHEAKMDREIALTVFIPLCIVAISLLARAIIMKLKQWRKRRMMERGITDLVSRVRG
jgi:hypothetical protein